MKAGKVASMARLGSKQRNGFFISFEGVDGAGKSTQIRLLADRLKRCGYRVLTLREPGGTIIGEKIRHLLQYDKKAQNMASTTETLLFCASRAQMVAEKILPALASGKVVLTDRFIDSTTVYQGFGRKLNVRLIKKINEFSVRSCRPDLTFALMMRADDSLKRARKNSKRYDRMETQKKSFYEAINRGYRRLARLESSRIKCIRADCPRDQVHAEIWGEISEKLKLL